MHDFAEFVRILYHIDYMGVAVQLLKEESFPCNNYYKYTKKFGIFN